MQKTTIIASVFSALVAAGSVYVIKDGQPVEAKVVPDSATAELLDELPQKDRDEIALVGPGASCRMGSTLLGNDKELTKGWVCGTGEGEVFVKASLQAALTEADKKVKDKKDKVEVEKVKEEK